MDFREIDISDRPWVTELLARSDFMGCEYSFANNMAWRRLSNSKICRYKDFYLVMSVRGKEMYFPFPAGSGDYRDVLEAIRIYAFDGGCRPVITGVTHKNLPVFEKYYGKRYRAELFDGYGDYIYNAADLTDLPGKNYQKKRNHLKKFLPLDWEFKPIETYEDMSRCIAFGAKRYNEKDSVLNGSGNSSHTAEQFAIHTFFENFHKLQLKGGMLFVSGELAAFTVGERLNSNTFCVHIEKADTKFPGVYAAINNKFAQFAAAGYTYINREEDLGIEGLRKAKRSYFPAFILHKHTVHYQ
ncbi:MAG: phosphatidylglycerol lysyltransferase domain-containing protein [Oscillospiraceae bacterium]|jgi:hypothetical protein|nr:phosphatidylglycerol lysyltransferase domain-containing protein [Oscillospiraceae bacterium]